MKGTDSKNALTQVRVTTIESLHHPWSLDDHHALVLHTSVLSPSLLRKITELHSGRV